MPGVVNAVVNRFERLAVQRVVQDTFKKAGISKFPDLSRLLNLRGCRKSLDPIAVLSYWLRHRVSLEVLRRGKHAAQHTTSLKPFCLQVPLTPADFSDHAKHLGSCGGAISNTAPLTDSDLKICVEVLAKLWEDYHLQSHLAEMQDKCPSPMLDDSAVDLFQIAGAFQHSIRGAAANSLEDTQPLPKGTRRIQIKSSQ